VVKELVENALDANATAVAVRLEAAVPNLVEVADDGVGMGADDAVLALERHATSKISSLDDLDALASLGFRGEALPSIASAARLVSRPPTPPARAPASNRLRPTHRGVAVRPPRGTTVTVRDLFLELPARRKFLRAAAPSCATRSRRHGARFTHPRVASRSPTAAARCSTCRRARRGAPAARPGRRRPARRAVAVEHAAGPIRIGGFLLPARGTRESSSRQRRVVRDRLLVGTVNRALTGASGGRTPTPGSRSSCLRGRRRQRPPDQGRGRFAEPDG